ncbi:MAG: amidase [Planctomycetota bacterium]
MTQSGSEPKAIQAAAELIGLKFDRSELLQMEGLIREQRDMFEALRRRSLDNSLAPAFRFDPLVHGRVPHSPVQGEEVWTPLEDFKLPEAEEDLCYASLEQLGALLRSGQISCLELTELFLARLQEVDADLHCVIQLLPERARAQARRLDEELARGEWRGPLHGLPWGAKDLFSTKGSRTTWGAQPFRDQTFDRDAAVVEKLDEAGAVLIAKLSLGALAMDDTWFGEKTRSPWNTKRGSSGSSAGSAAAVAAGGVAFALGTETCGSIVSPSTRCGATGLRPTFGRVSRYGAMALAWTMDKVGPICRSVRDTAIVFDTIRGADERDSSSRDAPFTHWRSLPPEELTIGYVPAQFEASKRDQHVLEELRELGYSLREVELPPAPGDLLEVILMSEAAAAFEELTRENLDDELVRQKPNSWPNLFRAARLIPAVEYVNANRARTSLCLAMNASMQSIDVLVHPSFGGPELAICNLTGHPTVVVPAGFAGEPAEPWSLCFTGRIDGEAEALEVARRWQESGSFHQRRPPLRDSAKGGPR